MKKSKVAPNNEKNNLQLALENGLPIVGMKGFIEVSPILDKDFEYNDQIVFVAVTAEGLVTENKDVLVKCKVTSSGSIVSVDPTRWINDLKTVTRLKDTAKRVNTAIADLLKIKRNHYHKMRAKSLQQYIDSFMAEPEINDFMENLKDTTGKTNLASLTVTQLTEAAILAVCVVNRVTPEERSSDYRLCSNRY